MATMSNLPMDLVEDALSRVPAASLKRARTTCKPWSTLFKNQRFNEEHFRKSAKESLVLMLKKGVVCTMGINLNVGTPSMELKGALSLEDPHSNSEQVFIIEVVHCDGLLLCTTTNKRLVVWNPCLGDSRWIQLSDSSVDSIISTYALGYYYQDNKTSRTYKILRYSWNATAFEIFELNSDSWRVLRVRDNCSIYPDSGVSLKGNTYWLASENACNFLLSFDFTTESLKRLSLPEKRGKMVLSVVRDEQLSVLHMNFARSEMEIWIRTNKIDTKDAWRKSFKVGLKIGKDTLKLEREFLKNMRCMSFLVNEEKKVVVVCIAKDSETSREVVCTVNIVGECDEYDTQTPGLKLSNSCWPIAFNYVPSLVRI